MRFSSITVLALTGLVSSTPVALDSRQSTGLQTAIVSKGRSYIGTSLTIRNDNSESNIINNKADFGSITPENSMKWDATEPNRYQFTFDAGDQVANYATQRGMQLRCHTLVWYSQLPSWVSNGRFDNATLISVMTNHIQQVMARWKGKCTHWDVVNEALNEDGTLRNNVFLQTIGPAYIPIAFRIAAAADPGAKLYYNDYNIEYAEAKALGAQRIVQQIQSWGVKIDGVGLQGHFVSASTPTQSVPTPSQEILEKSLRLFTDLGVDVAYTELDIRMPMPETSDKLAAQAAAYARVGAACIAVPKCIGITLWGVSDKYSWVPGTFSGEGSALLWNQNFQKKPAYQALLTSLST